MNIAEIVKIVEGAELKKMFSYDIDAKRWFFIVQTSIAPDVITMKKLYDMGMRVTYEIYADAEKGRHTMYVINHKRIEDYEWTDGTPIE